MDVLTKMEAEAEGAGRMLELVVQEQAQAGGDGRMEETAAGAWSPPENLGPIPLELVQRARDVEAAQQAAVVRLEEAKTTTARHLAAIQSVREAKASGHAVFLDVTS